MRIQFQILSVSIIVGLLLWLCDALLGTFFFNEGSFWNLLIFKVPPRSVYIRTVGIELFLIFGLVLSRIIVNRIKAERALRISEARQRAIFDVADNISFIILDPSKEEPKILEFSKGAERILGFKREEVIGRHASLIKLPKDIFSIFDTSSQLRNDKGEFTKEVNLTRKSGETFPAFFKSYPIFDIDGNMIANLVVSVDITEKKKDIERIKSLVDELEFKNIALDKQRILAEEASRLKSNFLANTSHELRTPLNAILGFIKLVLDGHCSSDKEVKEFLTHSYNSAIHLLSLINDILDIAKIEAGKIEINYNHVELKPIFDDLYKLMKVKAEEKGLNMIVNFNIIENFTIDTDPGKLKQILINLAGNAIKFTNKGTVKIITNINDKDDTIIIDVEDTGIGIPPGKHEKVFEPFVQADGETTRRYGGTGLGLTISSQLAKLLGGKLLIAESEEKIGTTMRLILPIETKET